MSGNQNDEASATSGSQSWPNRVLRQLFFLTVVYPVVLLVIGYNIRRRHLLPQRGPAMVVANHNSHLDTLVLMAIFGLRQLSRVRAVGAADYFTRYEALHWFATRVLGVILIDRHVRGMRKDPLEPIHRAIDGGDIVLLFPEGSRGEPEQLTEFKTGVAHLAVKHPQLPIVPVYLHGLGKALPRGEGLLVPFFCDVFIGEALHWTGDRESFMGELNARMHELQQEGHFPDWE